MSDTFRDLAVKAYEDATAGEVTITRRKLTRQFEEAFGVKPEEMDVGAKAVYIGPYSFKRQRSNIGETWMLRIECPACFNICECGEVVNLLNVGAKIKAWERDHECNVTMTSGGI